MMVYRNINFLAFGAAALTVGFLLMSVPASDVHAQGASALEEIVVTARRREENIQDVPIAITALSAEDIELRNIENTEDMQVLLPNVDIRGGGVTGTNASTLTIRGIPGVVRYVDGVAQTGDQGGLMNIVELERIEVLRGPQGTLFGKNAVGGAIQYITQKPGEDFGARVRISMGEYNRRDVIANIDIPVSDRLLTKITAASLRRDGYVRSVAVDQAYGSIDNTVLRGMVQWTPTDSFTALLSAEYTRDESTMQPNVLFDVLENFPIGPMVPERYNAYNVPFTDALYAYGQRKEWKNESDYIGVGKYFDSTAYTATLEWDINDRMTLKSITGVRDFKFGAYQDLDSTHFSMFNRWNYSNTSETTQEFQFLGNTDNLSWVVGLYYLDENDLGKFQSWQNMECDPMLPFCPRLTNTLSRVITKDTAVYAQATWDVNDKFSITAGIRSSNEEFSAHTYIPGVAISQDDKSPSRDMTYSYKLVSGVPMIQKASFSANTPLLAFRYNFNDTTMGYLTLSQGFNGGGVNRQFLPQLANNGILPYDAETYDNTEIGIKSDLLDDRLRLNFAYFDGSWTNMQICEVLTPGVCTTGNAGESVASGMELEGILQINDAFRFNFGLSSLDIHFTDVGKATSIDLNTIIPFSPENTFNVGFQFDTTLDDGASITTRVDHGWIDDFETFRDKRFQHMSKAANNGYGLTNARVIYTPAGGRWDAALHITNASNEYYRLGGFSASFAGLDQGVVGRPREVGLTLTMRLE